ncbi:glycosyltransferase family 2 protein [Flavitalea sp. BT771]|uniref:glycosyltransferase family 2 protein n=1 Tax=Flavitalea sp. BT771 TaxID=3063329 RepID=UPI0026E439CD|nr:glycosyltransferase family 2 protein [Flavitalea sp. BT771]MDO6431985.1 glycosyltransferase family 2 protein [Flavitalea sp. BT771]MDV6220894.1 glycosyltransferase family 2 protein [Flavitalea sp. BT771]
MIHMNAAPSVALVILNWNTSHYLKRFLPSLLNATYANKHIYVIDNDSKDDSLQMLRQEFPSVHVLPMKDNLGYASGYNFGLGQIDTDYYFLVNSDIQVTPGFIEPLIALLENNPHIGICQPKLLSLDNRSMFEYAGACGGWIDRLGFPFARGRVLTTIEEDHGQYDATEEIFWATGACMCFSAALFRKVGGFYDYYYMHQEDIDLCWRVRNIGYSIYACPQSVVYHIGGGSLSWENYLKTFLTFRNNYILLSRNLPFLHAAALVSIRLVTDFFGYFYFLFHNDPGISKAMAKAAFSYFKWLIFYRDKKNQQPKGWKKKSCIYKGTILFPYFLKNKRKFAELVGQTNILHAPGASQKI